MGQSPAGNSVSEGECGIEFHQGKIYFSDRFLLQSPQRTAEPTRIAPANSVLICVRAPVGTVNITLRYICIGRGLASATPLAGISTDFLFYFTAVPYIFEIVIFVLLFELALIVF